MQIQPLVGPANGVGVGSRVFHLRGRPVNVGNINSRGITFIETRLCKETSCNFGLALSRLALD
jgi:hypothetical protein